MLNFSRKSFWYKWKIKIENHKGTCWVICSCYYTAWFCLHGWNGKTLVREVWKYCIYCLSLKLNIKEQKIIVFFLYRILWLITISAGFAFSVIVINPLYDRFFNNPIIRSIESNNYPIENISFPAVTICSNNKVRTLSEKSKFCILHYDFM